MTTIIIGIIIGIVVFIIGFIMGQIPETNVSSLITPPPISPYWDYGMVKSRNNQLETENYLLRSQLCRSQYPFNSIGYERFLTNKEKEQLKKLADRAIVSFEDIKSLLNINSSFLGE